MSRARDDAIEGAGWGAAEAFAAAGLFLAAFLFFFVSTAPFVDLTDPASLLPAAGSNALNQVGVVALAASQIAFLAVVGRWPFRPLATPAMVLLLAWIALSVVVSVDPGLSARRGVLTLVVLAIAAGTLVLPRDADHFADLLAAAMLAVLAICYLGVLLLPAHAIHQAGELLEPEHAGHWRGPFTHKNGAGAAMVLVVFCGLYVARRRNLLLGWFIAAAAAFFLVQTMAKTSIALSLPALAGAWIVGALRATGPRCLVVLGGLLLVNAITVGSVAVPAIRDFNAATMADPTFTNRTDIWAYALDRVADRPWLGHGFGAFWGSQAVFFGESTSWANRATDAHSSYLDVALMLGLPGVALVLAVFVVGPLRDLRVAETSDHDGAATLLFVRIWVFCILYACLEAFAFSNGGPVWFMFLLAVFGLRFQACARPAARPVPAASRGASGLAGVRA